MNIEDLRIPCEPPCTEPYARWCGSRGRATAPSYPIFSPRLPFWTRSKVFVADRLEGDYWLSIHPLISPLPYFSMIQLKYEGSYRSRNSDVLLSVYSIS